MSTRLLLSMIGLALVTPARPAMAQTPPPATEPAPAAKDQAPPAKDPAPAPTEPAPAAPAANPAPAAPAAPAPANPALPFSLRAYGHAQGLIVVSNGVQSFSFPNASAPTAAANPAILAKPDDPFLEFQVQQTRLGVWVGEGSPVRAQVEIDFIHFDTASPTVQAFPRLRIAQLEWQPRENQKLFIGQGWDLFSPLNSHSINLVGSLFQAGNVGFLRHQLGWIGGFGNVEVAASIGFQGANAGPTFGNFERAATPTGALRLSIRSKKNLWIGLSGLATGLRLSGKAGDGTAVDQTRPAFGGNFFAELTFGGFNLRAEAYISQNLTNVGILGLGQARFDKDMTDAGGYVSVRQTIGAHSIYGMAGYAGVLNAADLVPGYTPANAMTGAAAAPSTAFGPGIEWNLTAHVGYSILLWKGLSAVVEPFVYYTRWKLDPGVTADPTRFAWGAELGGSYVF